MAINNNNRWGVRMNPPECAESEEWMRAVGDGALYEPDFGGTV
jgi:hypothetical protein